MAGHVAALIMPSIDPELVGLRPFYLLLHKQNQDIPIPTDCYLTNVPFPKPQSLPEIVSFVHKPDLIPGKLPSNSDQVLTLFELGQLPGRAARQTSTPPPDPYSFEDQAENVSE